MGKKILLADDSITIQKVIELTFSDEDFDVVTVGNGRLALERLAEVRPDIVLCDIIMPERDGYEVCEQIKSSPMWSHIPVLLLTGAFEPFDQARAARVGCDGSLAKPFEPETLIAKVKELLAKAPRPSPAAAIAQPPAAAAASPAVTPPRPAPASFGTPAPSFVSPLPAPSVVPFVRPATTTQPPLAAAASFIPEEPFAALDDATFPPEPVRGAPAQQTLAPMSPAEAASLSVPPASGTAVDDSSSTVLFRATQLPWDVGAQHPSAPSASEPAEPVFVPDAAEPEPPGEGPAFEAVLEEDLDFGTPEYVGEPAREASAVEAEPEPALPEAAEEPIFPPEITEPQEPRLEQGGTTGAFAALVREQYVVGDDAPGTDTAAFARPAVEAASAAEPAAATTPRAEPESYRQLLPPSAPRPAAAEAKAEEAKPAAPTPARAAEPEPEGLIEEFPEPEPDTLAPVPPTFLLRRPEPPAEEAAPEAAEPEPATDEAGAVAEEPAAPTFVEAEPAAAASVAAPPAEAEPQEPEPVVAPAPVAAPEPVAAVMAAPAAEATVEPAPAPAAVDVPEEETFADVVEPTSERRAEPVPAHAAEQAVPVEMVERIAQRVIAQISEKVIREIAWEVIPDLAETLIKQEIERLKQELAKL